MYCIDTDIVIEYLRGNNKVVAKIEEFKDKISLTPITLLELYFGAYLSDKKEEHLKQVRELIKQFDILNFNADSFTNFGLIKSDLMKKGMLLDNFDLCIASLALANNKILVTNNIQHFERIVRLKVENWLQS